MKKARPIKRNAPVKPGVYPRDGWYKAVANGRFTRLADAVKARAEFLAKQDRKVAA